MQTKKFKAQWNLIRSAGSQNISESIESKSPEQLHWWLTDKPYLHGMFLSNMSIINIKIFKWAALFLSKLCSNTTVRDKDQFMKHLLSVHLFYWLKFWGTSLKKNKFKRLMGKRHIGKKMQVVGEGGSGFPKGKQSKIQNMFRIQSFILM